MTIRNLVIVVLIMLLAGAPPVEAQQAVGESDVLRVLAEALGPGALVTVRLKDGSRVRGTLLQVSTADLLIQQNTRIKVAPRTLPLAEIQSIERRKEGPSPGAKVLAGAGIAALVIFLLVIGTSGG